MYTNEQLAGASAAFYKWEDESKITNLSDDDRLKWIDAYLYAKNINTGERVFTPDNIRYWTGDNMTSDQLYDLLAELVNGVYTLNDFRKDLADYFDGADE